MKKNIKDLQEQYAKLFILLMIIETIIRLTFCLTCSNKIYALSLTGILIVFCTINILYRYNHINVYVTIVIILSFYFFTHFVYVMGTYKFEPIMYLWFLLLPIATRIYYSNIISGLSFICILLIVYFMEQIALLSKITNHYKEIVLDHYGAQTAEFVIVLFVTIVCIYLIISIYYLIRVLSLEHKSKEESINTKECINSKDTENEMLEDSKRGVQTIKDVRLLGIYQQIEEYLSSSECYLNPEYSLDQLSSTLKINKITLSKALNRVGETHFKDLLNLYRVNKAKKLFTDDEYKNYNIKQVYLNAGFNYHTTFNRAFKKHEGMTPSEYIISLENNGPRSKEEDN